MTCLPLRYSHNKYVHAAYLKKKKKNFVNKGKTQYYKYC